MSFQMIPATIVVNGFEGLVGNDGLSVFPIKQLVNLGYLQQDAGTPVNPLRVERNLLTGKQKTRLYGTQTYKLRSHTPAHHQPLLIYRNLASKPVLRHGFSRVCHKITNGGCFGC